MSHLSKENYYQVGTKFQGKIWHFLLPFSFLKYLFYFTSELNLWMILLKKKYIFTESL